MPVKICPGCNTGVGPRTLVCKCGHSFDSSKTKPEITKFFPPIKEEYSPLRLTTAIPCGACPIKLTDTKTDTVLDWAAKLRERHDIEFDRTLSVNALCYWVRDFYAYGSPEYVDATKTLRELDKAKSENITVF